MRILWLKTELLHPVDKGGRIRTFQLLRQLKKEHHVTYLTLDDGNSAYDAVEKASEYADEIVTIPHKISPKFSIKFYYEIIKNLISRFPYAIQKYESDKMRGKVKELIEGGEFDVLVCDFLTPAINLSAGLSIASILFQHNVEALIWRRHFETAKSRIKKGFLKMQWYRMFAYEKKCSDKFDWIIAVSPDDAEIMRNDYGIQNVSIVSTGVDIRYFAPRKDVRKDKFNLVFTGSMDWLPNEDAMLWFTTEILPLVRKEIPEVSLTVVGRNPSSTLEKIGKNDPLIEITGRVDDVRPYMEKASIYIVPIRIGGGTRLKIFEAMAMELPVVSTVVGAEGLPLKNDEDILLRDDPQDFADAILLLLRNKELSHATAQRSAQTVRDNFDWARVGIEFGAVCENAILNRQTRIKDPEIHPVK